MRHIGKVFSVLFFVGILLSTIFSTTSATTGDQLIQVDKFILFRTESLISNGVASKIETLAPWFNAEGDRTLIYLSNFNDSDLIIRVKDFEIIGEVAQGSDVNIPYNFKIKIGKDEAERVLRLIGNYQISSRQFYYIVLAQVELIDKSGFQKHSFVVPGVYGYNKGQSGFSISLSERFGYSTGVNSRNEIFVRSYQEAAEYQSAINLISAARNIKGGIFVQQYQPSPRPRDGQYTTAKVGDRYTLYRCDPSIPNFKLAILEVADVSDNQVFFRYAPNAPYCEFSYLLPVDKVYCGQW